MTYRISDLVDIGVLKELSEKFTQITGLTIALFDYPEMNILVQSGWKDICTRFHRVNDASSQMCILYNRSLVEKLQKPGQMIIEKCGNGMYDCATPVFIQDRMVGAITTGQLFLEKPDMEYFRAQARKFGYNEEEYLKALGEVKIISEKELLLATSLLGQIAVFVSESGFNNLKIKQETLKLEHEIEERIKTEIELRKSEERYKTILALALEAFFHGNPTGDFIDVNEAAIELTGYTRDELLTMNMQDLFPKQVLESEPLRYDVLQAGTSLTRQRAM